jgi:O-antigen/teichoic acid export membrane protein
MILRNTLSTIELFSMIGMNQTTVKIVAEVENKSKQLSLTILSILTIILIITFISSLSLFIFADKFSLFFFNLNNEDIISGLKIGSIILFFSIYSTILTSILNGLDKYKEIATTNFYATILFLIPSIYIIKEYSLKGALFSVLIFFIISSFLKTLKVIYFIEKDLLKINFKYIRIKLLYILNFSFPIFLSIILIMPIFWYSKTLLISTSDRGFIEIANFEAAYQLLTIILIVTGAVANVALSAFSKSIKNQKKNLFMINVIINVIISIVFCLIFINYGKEILNIYGNDFNNVTLLKLLILTSIPFTVQSICNRFIMSISRVWINFLISLIWVITFILIIFMNLHSLDSIILAKAFLTSYVISCFISCFYIFIYFRKS